MKESKEKKKGRDSEIEILKRETVGVVDTCYPSVAAGPSQVRGTTGMGEGQRNKSYNYPLDLS